MKKPKLKKPKVNLMKKRKVGNSNTPIKMKSMKSMKGMNFKAMGGL